MRPAAPERPTERGDQLLADGYVSVKRREPAQALANPPASRSAQQTRERTLCRRHLTSTGSRPFACWALQLAFSGQRHALDVVRHREGTDGPERERDPLRAAALGRRSQPL